MSEMDAEFIAEFILDAQEMLEKVERGLLDLEQGSPFAECYRNIFSGLHNIKGAAPMFGFVNLEKTAHALEDQVQESQPHGRFAPQVVQALFEGIDQMRDLLIYKDQIQNETPQNSPAVALTPTASISQPCLATLNVKPAPLNQRDLNGWSGIQILVVDDDPEVLELLSRFLKRDFSVRLAESCDQAMEIFKSNDIHCVVCDINMPLKSGIDLLRDINRFGTEIPVVMISAQAEKDNLIQIIQNRAFSFLEKPFTQNQLLKATREALRQRARSVLAREKTQVLMSRISRAS